MKRWARRYGGGWSSLLAMVHWQRFPSAVDALSAAIEFQQAMQNASREPEDAAIIFRIGLHVGDLIVDGDDLYGDGVNVAARLEEAPPCTVASSSRTRPPMLFRPIEGDI